MRIAEGKLFPEFHTEMQRLNQGFGLSKVHGYNQGVRMAQPEDPDYLFYLSVYDKIINDTAGYMLSADKFCPVFVKDRENFLKIRQDKNLWVELPKLENSSLTLRHLQPDAVRFILTFKRGFLAGEMGSGKTAQAAYIMQHIAEQKISRFLWVTVKGGSLMQQTAHKIKKTFDCRDLHIHIPSGKNLQEKAMDIRMNEDREGIVFLCNYEMFRPETTCAKHSKKMSIICKGCKALSKAGTPIDPECPHCAECRAKTLEAQTCEACKSLAGKATNPVIQAFEDMEPGSSGMLFDAVVLDEASMLRNHTEHLRGLVSLRGGYWPGNKMTDTPYRLCDYLILMSAQFAPQSLTDWAHPFNFLHPAILPWNTHTAITRAGAERSYSGFVNGWTEHFKRQLTERVNDFAFKISSEDLAAHGLNIPIIPRQERVTMQKEQARLYREMADWLVAQIEKKKKVTLSEFDKLMNTMWGEGALPDDIQKTKNKHENKMRSIAQNALVQILRLQQITGGFCGGFEEINFDELEPGEEVSVKKVLHPISGPNPKLIRLMELVESEEFVGQPMVIATRFTHEIAMIYAELTNQGKKVTTIYGGNSSDQNYKNYLGFCEGEFDYVLLNPASGKFGGDYQRASVLITFSNSIKAEERNQLLGRLARDGQKAKFVSVIDIVAEDSVDLSVLAALKAKKKLSDSILYKIREVVGGTHETQILEEDVEENPEEEEKSEANTYIEKLITEALNDTNIKEEE